MNRNTLTGLSIGLIAGVVIGYFVGAAHFFDSDPLVPPAPVPVAGPAAPVPAAMAQLETQQRIANTEAALASDPRNVQAWVSLGNDCFDLHLSQKAVDAYAKALELAPSMPVAPDVLTDQGVMYRELKEYDKAIQDFQQAGKLNPKHLQSIYNLGIVYDLDKHNPAEALKAYNRILELAPGSPQAEMARKAIAVIKGGAK